MKKFILCLMSLLFPYTTFSQDDEWYWNESTKDAVYEAPNSKFVKKWCTPSSESGMPDDYLILNANGTCKLIQTTANRATGVRATVTMNGSWKRVDKMTLVTTVTNVTYVANQKDLAQLSARKRDENQKMIKSVQAKANKEFVGKKTYSSIYRVDDDHLIIDGGQYWRSERLRKKEVAEETRAAEEAKKAEEAKRAEEEAREKARIATEEARKAGEKVYDNVEEMPQFPGGPSAMFEYLSKNIKYPAVAEINGVQGRVIVSFVIERDGSVAYAMVEKSVEHSLDKEALRLVTAMPKWVPGKQDGVPVRVKYTVPVTFRL